MTEITTKQLLFEIVSVISRALDANSKSLRDDDSKKQKEAEDRREHLKKSSDDIKSTTKWIMSAFAAVGGALIAGLQLSNFGNVSGHIFIVAIISYLIAVSAVMCIIISSVSVLRTGQVDKTTLITYQKERTNKEVSLDDPSFIENYKTVEDFLADYKAKGDQNENAISNNDHETVNKLKPDIRKLKSIWTRLSPNASNLMVVHSFNIALRRMFYLSLVAVLSIGIFAWTTSTKLNATPIFQAPPSLTSLRLTDGGKEKMMGVLGDGCVAQETIPVILLSYQNNTFDVVTIPSDRCRVAKFTVASDIGTFEKSP